MNEHRLITWINTHDCGVNPTAIVNENHEIVIRVLCVHLDGTVSIEETAVDTYSQARDALGY